MQREEVMGSREKYQDELIAGADVECGRVSDSGGGADDAAAAAGLDIGAGAH